MNHALRAFRHRNFRLFYAGQAISLIGTWIQQIALSWLVYRTTGSGFLLGLVTFCSQIPMLIFVPLAGLLSDRYDRRKLMIAAYALAAAQALTLGILTLTATIRVWQILLLGFLYGVIMAFETPARQSLISQMVNSRDDLPNAIALNSVLMNSGRLIGPSIAGLLLVFVSEGWCFLINSVSFMAIIASVTLMRLPPRSAVVVPGSLLNDLAVAARYAWNTRPIRLFLTLVALISLTASPYMVLMPIFARDVFDGDAHTLGFLVGSAGLGAVIGTAFLTTRPNVFELSRLVPFTSAAAGIALVLVGVSKIYWVSLAFMACLGFGIIVTAASVNMMLQTIVDDDKRGRIISFYAMAFLGMAPLGGLIAGSLAGKLGAPVTAMVEGTCCLLGALALMRGLPAIRADLRRALSRFTVKS
ncbi:MAG: MFS transporter [Betaproteobacteria bacterium]|nr:MFS transporter [Betaproteobacteria bacterium]